MRELQSRTQAGEGLLTRERLSTLTLLGLTIIVLYVSYLLAEPFLPALAWALALAVITHPLHERLQRQLGKHRDLAAGLAVLVVAVLIVLPVILITQQVVRETRDTISRLQSQELQQKWEQTKQQHPRLAAAVEWLQRGTGSQSGAVAPSGDALPNMVRNTIAGILQVLIALFALFFFFRDRKQVLELLHWLAPLSDRETDRLFKRVNDTTYASIYGHVAVALVQGALGGLMFWWLGIPGPLLWGTVMALLAIVPVLGAFVIWVPAAIWLALQGSWGKALILTAWGTVVVGMIDNVLYPMLVGRRLRLHTLPVFLSIVGGLAVFGTSGIVLGPLTLSMAIALIEIWKMRTSSGQAAEDAA